MPNYEYHTIVIDTSSHDMIERTLNDMGRLGWELVEVLPDRTYIFKREMKVVGPSETKERKGTGPLSDAILRAREGKAK